MKKKNVLLVLALVVVVALASIGGTLAWLTATTENVTNTFTPTNIDITLTETWNTDTNKDSVADAWTAEIIPGNSYDKDPTVTVLAGSEECYVYVEVVKSAKLDDLITYSINTANWNLLNGVTGPHNGAVYAYKTTVAQAETDTKLDEIITDNSVSIANTITKDDMKDSGSLIDNQTLVFYAYAIQKANTGDAAAAWNTLSPTIPTTTAEPNT